LKGVWVDEVGAEQVEEWMEGMENRDVFDNAFTGDQGEVST
jgi:hypothetical protein